MPSGRLLQQSDLKSSSNRQVKRVRAAKLRHSAPCSTWVRRES